MKKLNRKELISIFSSWRRILDDEGIWGAHGWEDEQAYEQIGQMIEEYPYLKEKEEQLSEKQINKLMEIREARKAKLKRGRG